MGVIPREKFGQPGTQEVTAAGEPKWTAGVAVSYHPDPVTGIAPGPEVLNITIISRDDPGAACPPGTAVQFDGLRAGVSAPEQRERKDGSGTRVVGGKLFWSARSISPAVASSGWQSKSKSADNAA